MHDPATNRRRIAWALLVVLPASRHQYVHVTFSQTVAAVIEGLEDAWVFFGGVRRVGLDNLRAAIPKADRYDPIFQRTMEAYARDRGTGPRQGVALSRVSEGKGTTGRSRPSPKEATA